MVCTFQGPWYVHARGWPVRVSGRHSGTGQPIDLGAAAQVPLLRRDRRRGGRPRHRGAAEALEGRDQLASRLGSPPVVRQLTRWRAGTPKNAVIPIKVDQFLLIPLENSCENYVTPSKSHVNKGKNE